MNAQSGRPVTIDSGATHAVAATQAAAARSVAARSTAERIDTSALAPTFGLIGAEFLGALNRLESARANRLDTLAEQHAGTADRTRSASNSYDCCDATGACELTGVPA
ncbi:type VII secretion target [Gordonia neofelifaecis]|uniref:ESX-1 secretion-associated protein n=1 Tax=Gordonia neofelifaecis NRRL B-59395 TaxID=644548 RepID=F1YFZ0_9ACTN|nr:type VII secretion target [Gordonia neofelifaecis]EGD56567.1 hypothetical protein SCNU_03412 [Gordonia neofelifaecis NRRL B-59395]